MLLFGNGRYEQNLHAAILELYVVHNCQWQADENPRIEISYLADLQRAIPERSVDIVGGSRDLATVRRTKPEFGKRRGCTWLPDDREGHVFTRRAHTSARVSPPSSARAASMAASETRLRAQSWSSRS